MATKCSDESVLAGLFLAAYSGNLAGVKSTLKNNALSADVVDPNKVCTDGISVRTRRGRQQMGSNFPPQQQFCSPFHLSLPRCC